MSTVSASNDVNTSLKLKQVNPLPIGSGGDNDVKRQLNNMNLQLTMLQAQTAADSKFDPPVPTNVTRQATIEKFVVSDSSTSILAIVGLMLIAYGVISK